MVNFAFTVTFWLFQRIPLMYKSIHFFQTYMTSSVCKSNLFLEKLHFESCKTKNVSSIATIPKHWFSCQLFRQIKSLLGLDPIIITITLRNPWIEAN